MKLIRQLVLSVIFCVPALAVASNYPIVLDPVVNATPPGAKVSAGFLTLKNEGQQAITITDAYSPDIARVEIHLSSVVNDVAKMVKQDSLTIEPGASLILEHGSYHIMLMELTEPLTENSTVDIVLVTSSGDMLIEMPIKKMGHSMKHHMEGKESKEDHADMKHNDDSMEMSKDKMDDKATTTPAKVVH